jgi:hypothetical protein
MQPVNWVAVALTTALPLETTLDFPSTRFQEADTNTAVDKLPSDGDPSRPGPDDADVGDYFLLI